MSYEISKKFRDYIEAKFPDYIEAKFQNVVTPSQTRIENSYLFIHTIHQPMT